MFHPPKQPTGPQVAIDTDQETLNLAAILKVGAIEVPLRFTYKDLQALKDGIESWSRVFTAEEMANYKANIIKIEQILDARKKLEEDVKVAEGKILGGTSGDNI